MNSLKKNLPIGIFDSGVGGISVLAEAIKHLPYEHYLYYADSQNAPYGTKSSEEIRQFSVNAAYHLINKGIKALVVACNTATSVAVNHLREQLNIPVIGMEPAVKPAVELGKKGIIVVMATPVTISEKKFASLLQRFQADNIIIPLPCPGLVELIEDGETEGKLIQNYLDSLFASQDLHSISTIVLGCTHYVFIKEEIKKKMGNRITIIDGNAGTVRHLKNVLEKEGLLWDNAENSISPLNPESRTTFYTSGNSEKVIPLCQKLLAKALQNS